MEHNPKLVTGITDFDRECYEKINKCREMWLRTCIDQIPFKNELSTALDVGCGAGYFSGILHEIGFSVTGLDLREENIEVCRLRYPHCSFNTINLDENIDHIGTYDLVLLFGILYHLQSPLQTIPRLSKAIGRVGIISTRVSFGKKMAMYLFNEKQGVAHNIARITAVPTFPAFVNIFRITGFDYIYLPTEQPNHPQWKFYFGNGRRYSFLIAREPLNVPNWKLISSSNFLQKWEPLNLYERLLYMLFKLIGRIRKK